MSSPTEQARRAVRNATVSRLLSWLAAAIGLGFVIAFLAQAGLFHALLPRQDVPPPPNVEPDRITAGISTVNGIDDGKQPYQVTARRGWQDGKTPNLVHLEDPVGEFRRASGARYTITGTTGLYDTEVKSLNLDGNVVLEQEGRFKARMDKAKIAVKQKTLTADTPVTAQFGSGTVDANGMQITDDGARILFLNGVKARFTAAEAKGDTNP
ncbi:LPS export ABC transporter periplasmic protein LptC [Aestuariivirga litoralis]|uniref:LPS export ABC transporter periplasmic protein LptC n=1 Tax=Aestuariivirga litoralis TaxID=2650924 RepID=A0A2W2BT70_9HYPH|nr:LPS export ABC transporter periplasmic protein LptC [Aestuariivirga litoralis]PZF76646.1 LPS export ABC transporter periplasmic protein LptC [Aestuariivirga litoralis]